MIRNWAIKYSSFFFKFTGKSILNYAWSGEKQKTQASEEKGKNSADSLINENKSPEDITWMLNLAKAGINFQVYTINELWTNILNLIKKLWQMSTKSIDTPEEEKCTIHSIKFIKWNFFEILIWF